MKFHPLTTNRSVNGISLCHFLIPWKPSFKNHNGEEFYPVLMKWKRCRIIFFYVGSFGLLKAYLWNWFMSIQRWNHHVCSIKGPLKSPSKGSFPYKLDCAPCLIYFIGNLLAVCNQRRRALNFLASCVCWFGSSCDVTVWRPRKPTTWTRRRSLPPAREKNGCGGGLTSN